MAHEYDDYYRVYDIVETRARKEHRCAACGETIAVGHRYAAVHIVFDGAKTIRRCLRCEEIHKHLRAKCHASRDTIWPDERLNCGESYEDVWGEPPPPEIAALAFATPDEMQARSGERR